MRSDDFNEFLLPQGEETPFRQGVILTFNPATGANTVEVAGGTLTDIPLLNIGDTVNLVPGDVVILMKMKSSWAIMGRVIIPGSAGLAANVVATQTLSAGGAAVTIDGSDTVVAQTSNFTIPAWANRIDFIAVASGYATNPTATAEALYCSVAVDYSDAVQQASGVILTGIAGNGAIAPYTNQDIAAISQNYADFRTGSIGGLTFTANVRLRTNGTSMASAASARVSCIAVYTKV